MTSSAFTIPTSRKETNVKERTNIKANVMSFLMVESMPPNFILGKT
jgi:hypothetical protein